MGTREEELGQASEDVNSCMTWSQQSEGHDYWHGLHMRLAGNVGGAWSSHKYVTPINDVAATNPINRKERAMRAIEIMRKHGVEREACERLAAKVGMSSGSVLLLC